jgi:hypothetical protein
VLAITSCRPSSRPERWISPENYQGWLRLDYAITGTPPLALVNGAYVVHMPPNGHLQTSSPFNSSIDENEFLLATPRGPQRLGFSPSREANSQPPIHEYAVQSAFGFLTYASGVIHKPGKCVFVGPSAAFMDDGRWRDCRIWEPGISQPPRIQKPIAVLRPTEASND